MTEGATHTAIASTRSAAGLPTLTEATVRAALAEVPDPELPVLSIVDLGIVHRVTVRSDAIEVVILPTFVGCPALDVIKTSIAERLASFGRHVRVNTTFEVPWTSDRISPAGRAALASVGIAPPSMPEEVRCPFCTSPEVAMDSVFGPTQCRSLFYCRACRQPFEALKTV